MVTTSGCTPRCWKPNHRPVRPRPVWTSSTIRSTAAFGADLAHRAEVVRGGHDHACLAEDRLEQHRGDPGGVAGRRERGDVVVGHVVEAVGHRQEGLLLRDLTGGGECRHRAPVERVPGAHHREASRTAPIDGPA